MVATGWRVVDHPLSLPASEVPVPQTRTLAVRAEAPECLTGVMETVEPRLNKRPRGWLAAGGRGGGRRRRGGQRVGGARGSSGLRLEEGGGRPRPQAPPRLRVSPAAGGWMGLLQAVAAAAKVAAVAAAAAVSAPSINHLSFHSPFWDVRLLSVLGPLSLLPLPHCRVPPGRPLTSGEGLRENAPNLIPLPERRRPPKAHAQLPIAAQPLPAWSFALAATAEPIFPGVCSALGIRSGVSSPSPVRLGACLHSAQDPGRGGAKLTTPAWLRLFSPLISGFWSQPGGRV